MGGCGLGGVCDHSNHFGYHMKEIWLLKAWEGVTVLKGPEESTVLPQVHRQGASMLPGRPLHLATKQFLEASLLENCGKPIFSESQVL